MDSVTPHSIGMNEAFLNNRQVADCE
jgi:hypothetical protein